jgi:hypothetical protein
MDPGIVPDRGTNWAWGLPLVEHSGRERRSANYPAVQRDYEDRDGRTLPQRLRTLRTRGPLIERGFKCADRSGRC